MESRIENHGSSQGFVFRIFLAVQGGDRFVLSLPFFSSCGFASILVFRFYQYTTLGVGRNFNFFFADCRLYYWQPTVGGTVSSQTLFDAFKRVEALHGLKTFRWQITASQFRPNQRGTNSMNSCWIFLIMLLTPTTILHLLLYRRLASASRGLCEGAMGGVLLGGS